MKLFKSNDSLILFRGDLMYKLVGQRKLFCFMILIVAALSLNFSSITWAAPGTKSVEMSVKAGYDDVIRVGAASPFRITLMNKGDGFSGEVQVIVNTGYRSKTSYAVPFELPKGSTKEIALNVPIMTANRKAQVKIESNGKTIKELEYSFKKILSPEKPTIGILSDASNELRGLNGLTLNQNPNNMDQEMAYKYGKGMMMTSGQAMSVIVNPAEVFQLNKDNLPDSIEALAAFDYIIIADYDTSLFSEKQVKAFEKWVESGKELVIAGGTNEKKVYSGLSSALKPFEILGSKKVSILQELEKLTGKKLPADALVDVSTGNRGEGKILLGDEVNPLAVSYKKSDGKVLFIAFDPTLSPVSGWESAGEMWKKLLNESGQSVNYGMFGYNNYIDYGYNSVVNQVPEDQTPPYKNLMLIIVIYILIVGPLLYLFLKWKDKRDYSWVIIPIIAFLCIGIIYAAGFKTRYTSAVLNNYSIIHLDSQNKKVDIQTSAGVFNNKSGKMVVQYHDGYEIDIRSEEDRNYGYNYNGYSDEDYKNAQVKSKIYITEPKKQEMYNMSLWQSCILTAKQTQSYDGNLIKSIDINGNRFSTVIRNNTGFAFEDAFIVLGSNYIDVGEILPNQEKKVDISLDDKSVKKSYQEFMDSRYFSFDVIKQNLWPKNWREQMRRRNALENLINRGMANDIVRGTKVTFYALNFENLDYGVEINGQKAKTYNTNVIFTTEDLRFEKGKRVELAKGIISPIYEGGQNVEFRGNYQDGIIAHNDTEVLYKFDVPQDLLVDKFKIDWSDSIPEYLKAKYAAQSGVPQEQASEVSYKLYIYNNGLKSWESIEEVFEPKGDIAKYINELHEIKLKLGVDLDESTGQTEYLWQPEISLSGVKK